MTKTRLIKGFALICMGALAACTSDGGPAGNTELNVIIPNGAPNANPDALPTPANNAGSSAPGVIDIQSVEYTINCTGTAQDILGTPVPEGGAVQISGNLEVVDGRQDPQGAIPPEFGTERPGDGAEVWQGFMDLPEGPCTIQLRARDGDGEVICSAQENFTITPPGLSKVNLVMSCDISVQAPVGMLDVDATFTFVVGNFCPDLFVLNCNPQDETVGIIPTPIGLAAPAGCQVRYRDVDGSCGTACDPQTCYESPEGLVCTQPGGADITSPPALPSADQNPALPPLPFSPGPEPEVSTTVTCTSTTAAFPGIPVCSVDCDVNGSPDGDTCTFTGDQLGDPGQQPPNFNNPGPGGYVVAFTLCSQEIIDAGGVPGICEDASQIGEPIYPGAPCTCEAVTTDGDTDCDKTKSVTLLGPGNSPCVTAGCVPGEDCAFCDDGNSCTSDVCDDSSGAAACPNDPRPAGTSCPDFLPAGGACDGAGACEIQGCNADTDCPAGDPNLCTGQAPCNLATNLCEGNPPGNEGGSCGSSGTGSGAGICSGGSCDSIDECTPATQVADCGTNSNECLLNQCNTSGAPFVCETVDNDGAVCDGGAGICNGGACELPPVVGPGDGSTTWNLTCTVVGTVTVVLDPTLITLFVDSDGAGNVDFAYTIEANSPLLGGVADGAGILQLESFSTITNATPTSVTNSLLPTIPALTLESVVEQAIVPIRVLLATDPGSPAPTNLLGGPIPPAIDTVTQAVLPDPGATSVNFNWSGSFFLQVSAAGGALIVDVDENVCVVNSAGADIVLPVN